MSQLNGEERVRVFDSTNLYVKGLWNGCTQAVLDDIFQPYGVICQSRVYGCGVGFVRYETHQQACAAIHALNNTKPHPRCPQPLVIQFANKKVEKNKPVSNVENEKFEIFDSNNTRNVFIRNLPLNYTEVEFKVLCETYGAVNCIRLCKDYGFVRYFSETYAQNCVRYLHGQHLPNSKYPLVVKLANSDDPLGENNDLSLSNSFEVSIRQSQSIRSEQTSFTPSLSTTPTDSLRSDPSPGVTTTNNPVTFLPFGMNQLAPVIPTVSVNPLQPANNIVPLLMNMADNSSILANNMVLNTVSLLPIPQLSDFNNFYSTTNSFFKLIPNSQNITFPFTPQPTYFGNPTVNIPNFYVNIPNFSGKVPNVLTQNLML